MKSNKFVIEEALRGAALVTRSGLAVTDFKRRDRDQTQLAEYPFIANVEGQGAKTFTSDGMFFAHSNPDDTTSFHQYDLFMVEEIEHLLLQPDTLRMPDSPLAITKEELVDLHVPESMLQEAHSLIFGDREADYGRATDNFRNIAAGWNVQLAKKLKEEITPEDVCLLMVWLKLARQSNRPKRDNLVDAAGYIGLVDKIRRGQ